MSAHGIHRDQSWRYKLGSHQLEMDNYDGLEILKARGVYGIQTEKGFDVTVGIPSCGLAKEEHSKNPEVN